MATAESVINKINGLIATANAKTGRSDVELTSAVNALVDGYGQGGGGIIDVTELPTEGDENEIYRLMESSAELWVIMDGMKMQLAKFFEAQGASAKIPVYVVDELPAVMEMYDEPTLTMPVYVIESTGIGYVSVDGTSTTVFPIAYILFQSEGFDKGWVEDIDSIDVTAAENMGVWSVRCGTISTFYKYENGEWSKIETAAKVAYELSEDGAYYKAYATKAKLFGIVAIASEYNGLPVAEIKLQGFSGCSGITEIIIPDSVNIIREGAFQYCSSLEKVSGGEGITTIEDYAFNGCSSLTEMDFCKQVKSIGKWAFKRCTSMRHIGFWEGLVDIGEEAFSDMTSGIGSAYFDDDRSEQSSFLYIPSTVKTIGAYAFGAHPRAIYFLGTPDFIDENAFSGAGDITAIYVPWAEGAVANAPWNSNGHRVVYNHTTTFPTIQ